MNNKLLVRIEIEPDSLEERSGVSARTGKAYHMREQEAFIYLKSKFPEKIRISLGDDQPAYPAGVYQADLLDALKIGDFGRVEVEMRTWGKNKRLNLVPEVVSVADKKSA